MGSPLSIGLRLYMAYALTCGNYSSEQVTAFNNSIKSIEQWFLRIHYAFKNNRPAGLLCIPTASNWIKASVDNGNADLVYDYFKNLVEIISDTNPKLMPNAEVVEGVKYLHKIADYLIKTEYKF